MVRKKRIGFVSYWGFGRGQSQVTRMFVKMIKDKYDCYILKQFSNPISDDFKIIDNDKITEIPTYEVPKLLFEKWITTNELDAVVFNEYNQWTTNKNDLIPIAHKHGVKVYGYLVWEKYGKNEDYEDYDRIFCPTLSFCRFLRAHRFRKFTYVPYSVDLTEFEIEHHFDRNKVIFFHPAGWGGVHGRKGTAETLEAFQRVGKNFKVPVELIITSQKKLETKGESENIKIINKDLKRDVLLSYFKKSDCVVLPSKWETVGLSVIESLAMGKPVITTDSPPMNEFIKSGLNGFTCAVNYESLPDISVMVANPDIVSLSIQMENIANNKEILELMSKNSRKIAEEKYNLSKNKKYLLDFLDGDLID